MVSREIVSYINAFTEHYLTHYTYQILDYYDMLIYLFRCILCQCQMFFDVTLFRFALKCSLMDAFKVCLLALTVKLK